MEVILPQCTTYLALNNELMQLSKSAQERVHQQVLLQRQKDGLP